MDFQKIKNAQYLLSSTPHHIKVQCLKQMADRLYKNQEQILQANELDCQNATHLSSAMLERLQLDSKKIQAMAEGILQIASLPNPLDVVLKGWKNEKGLMIQKVSVPIGVIGIIYESRPNVTSDSAALCFKSGNVCILKGGKEAKHSNLCIAKILQDVLEEFRLPRECISTLQDYSPQSVLDFIAQDRYIDLLIPRGGEGLIKFVCENSKIPILKHDKGVCHLYIHLDSPYELAEQITLNAKTQRPSTCNSIETLLIHQDFAKQYLPRLIEALLQAGVQIKANLPLQSLLPLKEEDFYQEYGDKILNLKIVENLQEAITHINTYGSKHSESILTQNTQVAEEFLNQIDASCVYLNASTRFSDGGEFGFGAEIGISTNKLHARGPVGLEGLTTYKYKIYGQGQIRS